MHGTEGDFISAIQSIQFDDIRVAPGNAVMVATDMSGKALHGGVDIWDYVKTYKFVYFYPSLVFYYYYQCYFYQFISYYQHYYIPFTWTFNQIITDII